MQFQVISCYNSKHLILAAVKATHKADFYFSLGSTFGCPCFAGRETEAQEYTDQGCFSILKFRKTPGYFLHALTRLQVVKPVKQRALLSLRNTYIQRAPHSPPTKSCIFTVKQLKSILEGFASKGAHQMWVHLLGSTQLCTV